VFPWRDRVAPFFCGPVFINCIFISQSSDFIGIMNY
jgi:hypothetical protein